MHSNFIKGYFLHQKYHYSSLGNWLSRWRGLHGCFSMRMQACWISLSFSLIFLDFAVTPRLICISTLEIVLGTFQINFLLSYSWLISYYLISYIWLLLPNSQEIFLQGRIVVGGEGGREGILFYCPICQL